MFRFQVTYKLLLNREKQSILISGQKIGFACRVQIRFRVNLEIYEAIYRHSCQLTAGKAGFSNFDCQIVEK